jgi:hypothetical protein
MRAVLSRAVELTHTRITYCASKTLASPRIAGAKAMLMRTRPPLRAAARLLPLSFAPNSLKRHSWPSRRCQA